MACTICGRIVCLHSMPYTVPTDGAFPDPFVPASSQGQPSMISEDRVRQIVREELVKAAQRPVPRDNHPVAVLAGTTNMGSPRE